MSCGQYEHNSISLYVKPKYDILSKKFIDLKPQTEGNMKNELVQRVKMAMLAVQRYSWEQGVCMQALFESGDITTAYAMAHDAVLRKLQDGRLAVIEGPVAVTDPAASGEVVWHAYEHTGEYKYKEAAENMLDYLMKKAPRTDRNIICHTTESFYEGYSNKQIWVDSIYMAPGFIAVMGEKDEAINQIKGMYNYLVDTDTGLLNHIFDAEQNRYVREKLWATGNGWALMGIGRVIDIIKTDKCYEKETQELIIMQRSILDAMLEFELPDGRFHDILNETESFTDGASAMMLAAAINRGYVGGWIDEKYLIHARRISETMDKYVNEFGIIEHVCGCPHFLSEGTSAESMAAYLMMKAWEERIVK